MVGGLLLLVIGAEGLVRGSTALALRLGVTSLVIGLTIVAFGTGSPEFVLSVQAARAGNGGLALGNIVGSNISNIALVLGIAALVKPMRVRSELILREVPLMIAVTLVLGGMLLDGSLSRLDGLLLVLGAVAYTVFSYSAAKRGEGRAIEAEFDEALVSPKRRLSVDLILLATGLAALLLGANMLLKGAVFIAETLGISQVVIGLTIVAIGTSLPELATSVTSAIRGEADVAFGNVIGSNILNILAVLGVAALIRPFDVEGLRATDLAVMVASAVLLLPLMWRGSVLNRWEGAGLLCGYVVYLYSLLS
ncbi:MAG: calcium/sodium antiporter [Coriobacteriia bacterium]|nr:calcium/sodium antiporter [Coriobacteriia bacterium]